MTSVPRAPVSVVCVYNNPDVLRDCLKRSIAALSHEAPEIEILGVKNTSGQFPTAGAALNYGASIAKHDVIAFAHQDVYFHSLVALERSAAYLTANSGAGMLGAVGIRSNGSIAGRIRDRVVLIGDQLKAPVDVDSLDEVIFMVRRDLLRKLPLSSCPELAWHAYAVEYGLRLRARGMRVLAGNIPITHNSLTINLDRLDVAHAYVGALYPEALPVRTTCGVIRSRRRSIPGERFISRHRWRYRWFRDSVRTSSARRMAANTALVFSDIRLDVDDILAKVGSLKIVNYTGNSMFGSECADPIELTRNSHKISVCSATAHQLSAEVASIGTNDSLLITNLSSDALRSLFPALSSRRRLIGYHEKEYWALIGPAAEIIPVQWGFPRARPMGAWTGLSD